MRFQLKKRGGSRQIRPEFTQTGDKIIGAALWTESGSTSRERFMVFSVRGGKIVDMQGFTSRREAERFARR